MEKGRIVAYWNIYDSESRRVIEKEKAISRSAMPSAGALIVGIPGKLNAIVRDFKFVGSKDGLPCYDVYV